MIKRKLAIGLALACAAAVLAACQGENGDAKTAGSARPAATKLEGSPTNAVKAEDASSPEVTAEETTAPAQSPDRSELWTLQKNGDAVYTIVETPVEERGQTRIVGRSRYGSIILRALTDERKSEYDFYFHGDYEIVWKRSDGKETRIGLLPNTYLHLDAETTQMPVYAFGPYDVLLLQPINAWYEPIGEPRTVKTYAYAVGTSGTAFPLRFYSDKAGEKTDSAFIPAEINNRIKQENGRLLMDTLLPELTRLEFTPDFSQKRLMLVSHEDVSVEHKKAFDLAVRYAAVMEAAILVEWHTSELARTGEVKTLADVRPYFTDTGWNSRAFQVAMRQGRFPENGGTFGGPFRWDPIYCEFAGENELHFTYTMNTLNAIGLAYYMDVTLTKDSAGWKISQVDHPRRQPRFGIFKIDGEAT